MVQGVGPVVAAHQVTVGAKTEGGATYAPDGARLESGAKSLSCCFAAL